MEVIGKVVYLKETTRNPQYPSKELALEVQGNNPQYKNYIALELFGNSINIADSFAPGTEVTCQFDVRGNMGKDGKVWNRLSCWRIQPYMVQGPTQRPQNFVSQPAPQGFAQQGTAQNQGFTQPQGYPYQQPQAAPQQGDDGIPF